MGSTVRWCWTPEVLKAGLPPPRLRILTLPPHPIPDPLPPLPVFYTLRESAPGGREASRLQSQLAALQSHAAELSVPNAYGSLLQQQGAVGLNAATSQDATRYYVSTRRGEKG